MVWNSQGTSTWNFAFQRLIFSCLQFQTQFWLISTTKKNPILKQNTGWEGGNKKFVEGQSRADFSCTLLNDACICPWICRLRSQQELWVQIAHLFWALQHDIVVCTSLRVHATSLSVLLCAYDVSQIFRGTLQKRIFLGTSRKRISADTRCRSNHRFGLGSSSVRPWLCHVYLEDSKGHSYRRTKKDSTQLIELHLSSVQICTIWLYTSNSGTQSHDM